MNILSARNLSKTHGVKELFRQVTLGMEERDRVALIGVNGSGKSTLLQVLAGLQKPDEGELTFKQGLKIEYLPQNPTFSEGGVLDWLFSAETEVAQCVRQYEAACAKLSKHGGDTDLLKAVEELTHRMDALQAWEYEFQARTVLGKLGVTDLDVPVQTLSGGYRKRVALAHALLSDADLLLLDEPTNHLDADTIAWLEGWLERFRGAVLLVTHDRYFLDRVTDKIIELESSELLMFEGNFSHYIERKAEIAAAEVAEEARRGSILRKELAWLRRGARARRTKEKHRIERIQDMQDQQGPRSSEAVSFTVDSPRMGGKILELEGVTKNYGSKMVVPEFTYTFKAGERLGIIGPNGSGKTTLANIITGRTAPDAGTRSAGQTIVFGYFDQESLELDPSDRAIDYVKREGGDMLRGSDGSTIGAALMMERFNFTPQMLYTRIEKLSGGERRRLFLVRTLMRNPNFLVLDEPANDLDIATLQALEDFLDSYRGCLLIISHDRYLLDRTIDRILAFDSEGNLRTYPGGYSDYERLRSEEGEKGEKKTIPVKSPDQAQKTAQKTKSTKLSFNEQRELKKLEDEIPAIESRLKQLDEEIGASGTDYLRLQELASEQKSLNEKLNQFVDRWSELAERAG